MLCYATCVLHCTVAELAAERLEMFGGGFTVEQGRAALTALLSAFENPPHLGRIQAAKQEAGNSMIRYQQIVFPLCTEIQLEVISQFGFPPDGEGVIQFTQHIKLMEREDQEVIRDVYSANHSTIL